MPTNSAMMVNSSSVSFNRLGLMSPYPMVLIVVIEK
jgi:hypothetical protein